MLSVHELTRDFGDRRALDHVSFEVRPGRITGFVGANGAGKTTTMRILVGVLAATSGSVTWDGRPIDSQRRRSFGYMPEERGLYSKMSSLDQLVFFARLHDLTAAEATGRARTLLDRLGLGDRVDEPLEKLSLGNQQRVQIAAALIHHPTALVLDEPFSGLDPLAVDALVSLLREEMSTDLPVLFSSHQLDLVERLCDDLVILSDGRVVASGTVEELRHRQQPRHRVVLEDGQDTGWLREVAGVTVLESSGPRALIELGDRSAGAVLTELTTRSCVSEFAPETPSLSDLYREAVR